MAVRPEYFRKRINLGAFVPNETDKAADLLEGVIDQFLRRHVADLARQRYVSFPLVQGTDQAVIDDVLLRYRSVGWEVDVLPGDGGDELCFRLPANVPER
jgi:hypothetical protein